MSRRSALFEEYILSRALTLSSNATHRLSGVGGVHVCTYVKAVERLPLNQQRSKEYYCCFDMVTKNIKLRCEECLGRDYNVHDMARPAEYLCKLSNINKKGLRARTRQFKSPVFSAHSAY